MSVKKTKIGWTDYNYNPFFGCTKCSRACKYCYAEKIAKRGGMDFAERRHTDTYNHDGISSVKGSRKFFVNTMSDTFHKDFSLTEIKHVYDTMALYPQHTFQILTKRAERMALLSSKLDWKPNMWAGVTVEHPDYKYRIDYLRQVPASIRFLSIEPLLADMGTLNLEGIDWVIIGGLSGASKGTIQKLGLTQANFDSWVWNIITQCRKQGVRVFFKQGFGFRPEKEPKIKGKQYLEFP